MKRKVMSARNLVLLALLLAMVVVLQLLGSFVRFGPFSISLVLMPIVVGAAIAGPYAGGALGLAFGFAVLLSGNAALFLAVNAPAAVAVVLLKGMLAGQASGIVYRLFSKVNQTAAALLAAAVCPIVNTGVFVIGTYVFFLPTVAEWGVEAGAVSVTAYIFLGMIGLNFLIELGLNLALGSVIVRLIQYGLDKREEQGGKNPVEF